MVLQHLGLTLCQPSHKLQTPCGSQVDASPLQLVIVQEGAGRGRVSALCHVTHLHGPSCQFKTIQLLQGFLCTFRICKLKCASTKARSRCKIKQNRTHCNNPDLVLITN